MLHIVSIHNNKTATCFIIRIPKPIFNKRYQLGTYTERNMTQFSYKEKEFSITFYYIKNRTFSNAPRLLVTAFGKILIKQEFFFLQAAQPV